MDYNKVLSLVYQASKIVFTEKHDAKEKDNEYDFVTAVDTGISNFLKEQLAIAFPNVGFMTEEESKHSLSDKTFILDPIDGTTNLVYNYNRSSISLAYAEKSVVMAGFVFNPFDGELFFSIRGKGSHFYNALNGIDELLEIGVQNYTQNLLKVSDRKLNRALIEFGASSSKKNMADETFDRAKRVFTNCLDLRRNCSTALVLCYISAGRLDGYFEKIIKPWDYAAGCLILEQAGGKSSDWFNSPLPLDREGTIVCSNGVIHQDLIDLM